jgi:glycolate oxidase iron-sulfur subunit
LIKPSYIINLTSQCVMCGICIPSCPTYQISQDENRSPRGRISLIQALEQNKITLTDNVKSHLDSCLQCLTCQAICPSQVNYSEIISYIHEKNFTKSLFSLNLSHLILINKYFRKSFIIINNLLIQFNLLSTLKRIALKLQIKSIQLLPEKTIQLPDLLVKPQYTDQISLFSGCASSLFNSQLTQQCCYLFEKIKVSIVYNDTDNCCGAIYKKQGDIRALNQLTEKVNAFYSSNDKLVSLNSTCSGYMQRTSKDRNYQVSDIISVLANDYWQRIINIKFNPFPFKILFHQSCSMRNILKSQQDCYQLLQLIPKIEITHFLQSNCCGAAGNYMFTQADLAEEIAQPYIDYIIKENIRYMVSTDISCSLHIKQQLNQQNYQLEVFHPVSLLYKQLADN